MAYLSKEQYEARERYAERKMSKNAEIETLTKEQHDALAAICRIRHYVHSSDFPKKLFYAEYPQDEELWGFICGDRIDELIKENNLPKWEWRGCDPCDYGCDWCLDWDMHNEVYFENEADYEKRAEEIEDELRYKYLSELYDLVESWNKSIEAYLKEIDEQHGTEYCPTGRNRIF